MYDDNDSVSTFHRDTHSVPVNLAPSTKFTPQMTPIPSTTAASSSCNSKPIDIDYQEHDESVSKLSDTQSRISTLESDIKHLNHSFKNAISELKLQSKQQVEQQQMHESTLAEILALLKQSKLPSDVTSAPSVRDNLPDQSTATSGSSGAAGSG
jgi:TolA-binding protein